MIIGLYACILSLSCACACASAVRSHNKLSCAYAYTYSYIIHTTSLKNQCCRLHCIAISFKKEFITSVLLNHVKRILKGFFFQEDARQAAKDEEERIQVIMEVHVVWLTNSSVQSITDLFLISDHFLLF